MDNSEEPTGIDCEMPQQQSLPLENNSPLANDITDSLKDADQNINSENQKSGETIDSSSQNVIVAPEADLTIPSADNSVPPLPPLPKDNKELPQPPAPYSADYNMQNYANYNYMYNYNNYYGYPYPQYQWDYNSQQYYQPYQNYYNYNYNATQTQTAKASSPPSDTIQLPVEEKPANKTSATTVDDSNRYSPTAEPDDDDTTKVALSENKKSDILVKPSPTSTPQITTVLTNSVSSQNVSSEKTQIPQSISENTESKIQQPIVPLVTSVQQPIVPVIAQTQPYNILVQQSSYLNNSQIKTQPTEAVNELTTQQQNSPTLNGKDDSAEKVSKASTVLGKTQAKKRLMAFSMMKQKLQEQNNSITDNQSSDVGEGNDVEFMPELNVFQSVAKKKVITNKKVIKVIKAQQTIEQIEEMKKDELLQGNNAALYQHLLRSGGNEAPILQKLGIESLAEKYSAKIREQDKRLKRHHHRRRDDRRGHKYRRRSYSKSRSRSKSKSRSRSKSVEKPKMRALEVKSWKDFINGGFHFDKFRRFKLDEAEELKEKERKSRSKKRHRDSRTDSKNQNSESIISIETEKGNEERNLRYNLLDRKKEILKGLEVVSYEGDCTKDFPSYLIHYTKSKPVVKYSQNPAKATCHFQTRQQMLATLLPEVEAIVHKFFSSMIPKKLKENPIENYNYVDDKLLVIMKDKNIYPFKGWWPKQSFIITQVKEDPNVEIDKDAFLNEFTISKRTKKSRFNDSLVDLRPTVPSKWDSDYDGSPAADKVTDIDVTQSVEMNTNDICINNGDENNHPDISNQEEVMDIDEAERKIKSNICPIVSTLSQGPPVHAKLDTEYEEFLKIVSAKKADEEYVNTMPIAAVEKENESNLSVNLSSFNNESLLDEESEDDTSTKSSDESVSLPNTAEESVDRTFIKSSSSTDKKLKKKKKTPSKKSKKFKKKENKKNKYKSSSSESSQDSESDESDSSSEEESESTDSSSSVEKKKKKKKLKDRKKKKNKLNYKKKHKIDKNKSKKSENERDSNNSILNLLEKAFNVEIKKRPVESDEPKQKKKKRKHDKKEKKSAEDNDEFEKVKECLKETFTKLVKTDKLKKNQSLSCDDTTVGEVLKYLKIDKERFKKNKKSKKSSKRKCDSDESDDEKSIKRTKLDDSLKLDDNEKKRKKRKKSSGKKSVDSDEHVLKKKSKKKSKSSDTSDTEDELEPTYKNSKKEKDSDNFFGQRPNDWNVNNESSMREVICHTVDENTNYTFTNNSSDTDDVKTMKAKNISPILSGKMSWFSDTEKDDGEKYVFPEILKEHAGQINKTESLDIFDENIKEIKNNKNSFQEKLCINFKISGNESVKKECNFESNNVFDKFDQCDSMIENKNDDTSKDNKQQCDIKDINTVLKSTLNKSFDQNDKPVITTIIKPIVPKEQISYRDKVKMNLLKLSTCQDIPFVFGFSSPLNIIKPNSLNKEKITEEVQVSNEEIKKPEEDESKLLKFTDRPKIVIYPQTQKKKLNVPPILSSEMYEVNNEIFDQNSNLDNLEKSYSDNSSIASINSLEHTSDEDDEGINSNLLEDYLTSINDENQKYKNETLLKEQLADSFDTTDTNRNSENKENGEFSKVEQNVDDEITTNFSNSTDMNKSEHVEFNAEVCQHDESRKIISPERRDSDSVCSQQSSINLEVTEIKLITQWISDWSMLDKSVKETNNCINSGINIGNEYEMKKKSRWDKQSKDNIINDLQKAFDAEEKDEKSNYATDELKTTSAQSDLDIFLAKQNEQDAFTSSNYVDDSTEYDCNTSKNWFHSYNEYSQSCEQQYSCELPQYSEMKEIEYDQLSPVDYSVYENYNPIYDDCENYENWKSIDGGSHQLATDSEMSIPIQMGNVLEILPSENVTTAPNIQDEKMNNDYRNAHFFQFYQQFFQHYNQNPIKYSMCNPVFTHMNNVNKSVLDELSSQENVDSESENKTALIPLQERAYVHILEDDNTILYMTNDNYIAYCAIEDKCMVHVALDAINREGIDDKVRHCFNIYQSGTVIEYWLNADLIPFQGSSDSESGVFSDDEMCSDRSNSDKEEDDNLDNNNDEDDNNVDDNIIEGKWELVDSDDEDKDGWLKNPYLLKKYGNSLDGIVHNLEHTIHESDSSEYDTDTNDCSDSNVVTDPSEKQNVIVNPFQLSLIETEDNTNNIQNVDVNTPIDAVEQTENISENLDLNVETNDSVTLPDQSLLNVETEQYVDENFTSEINTEINDNVSTEFEEKVKDEEKDSDMLLKDGIPIKDLTMLNTIIKQQMLIQRLKICAKKKLKKKLPDTSLVCYSDNMESIKHPFLGLFQPPTISILSKGRDTKTDKRVTFADGVNPGDIMATSPTHDDIGRPLSPPPLKALMRESLKLKRNMYPFKKLKKRRRRRRTKLIMTKNKKIAMVRPLIVSADSSSTIKYYIDPSRSQPSNVMNTVDNNSIDRSDDSSNSNNVSPPELIDVTPVPSDDNDFWNDDASNLNLNPE